MRKLVEYRTQESQCRQRAVLDAANEAHWLLQAEMWQQRVAQEISSYFDECNTSRRPSGIKTSA